MTSRVITVRSTPEAFDNLPLRGSVLDRNAALRENPAALRALFTADTTRVAAIRDGQMRVTQSDGRPALLHRAPAPGDVDRLWFYLGRDHEEQDWIVVSDAEPTPAEPDLTGTDTGLHGTDADAPWHDLRLIGAKLDTRDAEVFVTALGLHNWHQGHTHCSRCGAATEPDRGGWSRNCPIDASAHFPRTDPAVIMSVVDADDRLLIARGATWPEGRFSVLAGFVEPGETMAQAVAREVAEEVGIEVTDVEFVADQPWPFPSSLMLGFTARATSTDIHLIDGELAEARWISRDEVPAFVAEGRWAPLGRMSIASRLIEHWYGGRLPRAPR